MKWSAKAGGLTLGKTTQARSFALSVSWQHVQPGVAVEIILL